MVSNIKDHSNEYTSLATFSDLTQDVLRKIVVPLGLVDRCRLMVTSRALKEAVENSKWNNLGDGKLVVATEENGIVHVSIGGLITACSSEQNWEEVFTKLHRTFERLHLKELQLKNVSLDHPLLQSVNNFLDNGVTFDRLSFMRSEAGPISNRDYDLIKRAKRDIVFDVHMGSRLTEQQILSFTRPVTLNIVENRDWTGSAEEMCVHEVLFLELVRRGHSLITFRTELTSPETLAEIVETISSSPVPQMCQFRIPYAVGQSYVDAVDAPPIYGPQERRCKFTSYLHLSAKIMLDHSPLPQRQFHYMLVGGAVVGGPPRAAGPNPAVYRPAQVAVTSRDHPVGPAATISPW